MKILVILVLIITSGLLSEGAAQPQFTRIVRFEVNGKEIKKDYRVSFLSRGNWIAAQKTGAGFALPKELKNEEHLTLVIAFGKHRLKFEEVHISNFKTDWVVGVDKKPFSEEFVKPDEQETVEQVYYLLFEGEPSRYLVITKRKQQR